MLNVDKNNSHKIFIVIPTYNEKENIKNLIGKIFQQGILNLNIIVVDDNSPDGTGNILDTLVAKTSVRVIHRSNKLGIGSAYINGFNLALQNGADLIFEMDADLSHDPAALCHFLTAIENGAEVIVGSRRIPGGKIIGWGLSRILMSRGATQFSRLILGLKTFDVTSGFRCYKREVLEKIKIDTIKSNGYAFQEEILWRCEKYGFKIKEVPIVFVDRSRGKTKLSFMEVINFFITVLRLKFKKQN